MFAFLLLGLMLASGAGPGMAEGGETPLDLNRATSAELEALPGIGAVKAAAILAVRDAQGGFRTMDELEAVRGIGPALVAKLRPLVVLGAAKSQTQPAKPASDKSSGRSAGKVARGAKDQK